MQNIINDEFLSAATYNIHRCIGRDRRYDPERVRRVLRQLDANIVALQEVELLTEQPDLLQFLAMDRPWHIVPGITLLREAGHYGNALLTSLPVESVQRVDLSMNTREPRGAILATLGFRAMRIQVIATHLGLSPGERRAQIRKLLDTIDAGNSGVKPDCVLLMGDINEWFPWSRAIRWLHRRFTRSPAPATFPASHPVLALDRIWVNPSACLLGTSTLKSQDSMVASDHLPLLARIRPAKTSR